MRNLIQTLLLFSLVLPLAMSIQAQEKFGASQADISPLFDALLQATNEQEGRIAESAIWEHWFSQSPTAEIRAWLDAGIERREAYDYEAAEQHFDNIVEQAPDYAEGYNQRAFIRFLRDNDQGAEEDLQKVLELDPRHFGAYSGMFHIMTKRDRKKVAMGMLQEAVTINPWIQERHALPKALWPDSYRRIHEPGQEI